jgi:hypothetical protein
LCPAEYVPPEDGGRNPEEVSETVRVLNKKRTMNNVRKHSNSISLFSSFVLWTNIRGMIFLLMFFAE